jgi:hypothetical protein
MTLTPHQRALLPLIALQGAVATIGGFIGFFVVGKQDVNAMFRFTAGMLTAAMVSTFIAYYFGPRLHLTGKRLLKLGFLIPGLLILFGGGSVAVLAIAYGSFLGLTWGARHSLEMSLVQDAQRDRYASHSGTFTVVFGIAATLAATLVLASSEDSNHVYWLYGVLCLAGAFLFGNNIPETPPVSIKDPVSVIRQPEFLACLPLFFVESGLFGVTQALSSAGAVKALGSASHFGWVATLASLIGGVALYFTRQNRSAENRARWLGGACLMVGISFIFLGLSAWLPVLFIAHTVLKAAAGPFLYASEQVLNQRTLDIKGELSDRIFAREFVLWVLRMISLGMFWALANVLSPTHMLAVGSVLLTTATATEYLVGQALLGNRRGADLGMAMTGAPLKQTA